MRPIVVCSGKQRKDDEVTQAAIVLQTSAIERKKNYSIFVRALFFGTKNGTNNCHAHFMTVQYKKKKKHNVRVLGTVPSASLYGMHLTMHNAVNARGCLIMPHAPRVKRKIGR